MILYPLPELWLPSCSEEINHYSNSGKGPRVTFFYEIILKMAQWSRRRCCLKGFSVSSSASYFVQ